MNEKFTILRSTCVPLPLENVDTDQIIPARFLKATTKEGFGDNLFYDWRYDKQGHPIPSFVLNNPAYAGARILVAGTTGVKEGEVIKPLTEEAYAKQQEAIRQQMMGKGGAAEKH